MYTVAVIGNATSDVMDLLGTRRFMLFRTAAQGADWRAQFDAIMQAGESDPSGRAAIACENTEQTQYLLDAGAGKLDAHGDGAHAERVGRWLEVQFPRVESEPKTVNDLIEGLETDMQNLASALFDLVASRNLDRRFIDLHRALDAVKRSARLVRRVPV